MDVVIITTPSGAHLEPAVAAAKAGKHVVVEKPLEITARALRPHHRRLRQEPASSSAPSSRRASPTPTSTLKNAVDAGRFGRLTLGETTCKWWRTQEYYDEGGWKGTQALDGGGALMNQAIHNVDLLLWMMGPVDARQRLHRHAGPRAHRGRGHGRRLPALQERRARRDPGDDERPSRLPEDDRDPRRPRLGGDRAGRRAALGLQPGDRRGRGECRSGFAQKVGAIGRGERPERRSRTRAPPAARPTSCRRSETNRPPKVDGREPETVASLCAIYDSMRTARWSRFDDRHAHPLVTKLAGRRPAEPIVQFRRKRGADSARRDAGRRHDGGVGDGLAERSGRGSARHQWNAGSRRLVPGLHAIGVANPHRADAERLRRADAALATREVALKGYLGYLHTIRAIPAIGRITSWPRRMGCRSSSTPATPTRPSPRCVTPTRCWSMRWRSTIAA